MLQRTSLRFRRLARLALSKADEPELAARGLAAGFFAAAFPLPGLQIPFSLLLAWLVRGNKTIAVFPQFISNAGTMLPLAWLQYWIGSKVWPGASEADLAMSGVKESVESWSWLAPWSSLQELFAQLFGLGADIIGPLLIGVIITGIGLAMVSYPLGLIGFTWYRNYVTRRRRKVGIGRRPQRPLQLSVPAAGPQLTAEAAGALFAIKRAPVVMADGVKLLVDGGQAFPEMLGCIAAARTSVDLETYILNADFTGRRFAAALVQAARRGVAVRVLYDGVGGLGVTRAYVDTLLDAGVRVAVYRPLSNFWKSGLSPLNRRDHRKILIIDNQVGFTGGLNIADEYASVEDSGGGWRDTHVRLDGAIPVKQLSGLFNETWMVADEFERPPEGVAAEEGILAAVASLPPGNECKTSYTSRNVRVQILSNKEFLQRVRLRRSYLQAIRNAKHYILIENAYFIPDRGVRRALYRAAKRGVSVAVIIPKDSDIKVIALATRALYGELLSGGVRVYEYHSSMVHSKCAVIDDVWSMVSSYNLDHRSLMHNLEAGVLILDRTFATAMRSQVCIDIGRSNEVTLDLYDARPWNQALLESLAYQARYWL